MPPTAATNSNPRANVNKVQSQSRSYASATVVMPYRRVVGDE